MGDHQEKKRMVKKLLTIFRRLKRLRFTKNTLRAFIQTSNRSINPKRVWNSFLTSFSNAPKTLNELEFTFNGTIKHNVVSFFDDVAKNIFNLANPIELISFVSGKDTNRILRRYHRADYVYKDK